MRLINFEKKKQKPVKPKIVKIYSWAVSVKRYFNKFKTNSPFI